MSEASLKLKGWNRIVAGKRLDGLPLSMKGERIDLTGLVLPAQSVKRRFSFRAIPLQGVTSTTLRGVRLQDLDLSDSRLPGLRLVDCEIENCRFVGSAFEDLRIWSTKVHNSSFKRAHLCGAVLGGVQDNRLCFYRGVDFSGADMRKTVYKAAVFERCLFCDTKLVNVDFQGSNFVDCIFRGELRDVMFYRHAFQGEQFPPNEMIDVDFTGASLRDVGFRGLVLDRVRFPKDDDHIVIRNFASSLAQMKTTFEGQEDDTAKLVVRFVGVLQKWAAPDQVQGVVNVLDLVEVVGEEGKDRFVAAVPSSNRS